MRIKSEKVKAIHDKKLRVQRIKGPSINIGGVVPFYSY